jgi:hypothetical protein
MKYPFLVALAILLSSYTFAQENTSGFVKLNSFQLSNGIAYDTYFSAPSFDNFKKLSHDQSIFDMDLSTFQENHSNMHPHLRTSFEANIGLVFKNKEGNYNPQRELQLGFGFGSYSANAYNFHKQENYRIDTLTSSSTGDMIFVDSIIQEGHYFRHQADLVHVSAKMLFKSDTKKRVYAYVGPGVSLGFSINSEIMYSHREGSYYSNTLSSYHPPYMNGGFIFGGQIAKADPVLSIAGELKTGINFRFSNQHDFWKHWNVFAEYGIGLNYTQVGKNNGGTEIGNHLQLGLRYTLKEGC